MIENSITIEGLYQLGTILSLTCKIMQRVIFILSFNLAAVVVFAACNAVQESSSMAFDNANEVIKYYSPGQSSGNRNNTGDNAAVVSQQTVELKESIREEDITNNSNKQSGGSNNYGTVSYQPTEVELIELGSEIKR